jgi:hypothetical protein
MNLVYSLFLFLLSLLSSFSPTPSYAQSPDSTPPVTTTNPPSSGSDVSSSPASTNSTASTTPTTFANLTTTNSQGSTIVTSVPITVGPSTTPSTTSSAPFPSLTGYSTCGTFHYKPKTMPSPSPSFHARADLFPFSFFFFLLFLSPPPHFQLRSNQLSNRRCCASQLLQYHSSRLLLHKPVCQSPSPLTSHTCNFTIFPPSLHHQNRTFPATLYACVASNCGANVPSAESLAQRFCAIDNVTLSFASTAALSSSSPSSASATKSSSSSSSAPSNAAPATVWMPDRRGWSGMALAACGAVFGAALL